MEFKFDVQRFCKPSKDGLLLLLPQPTYRTPQICEILDTMGRASSIAQSLPSTITTSARFFASTDNKLYLKIDSNKVLGILKTGVRRLFYTSETGRMLEITPLCLLDFYIHESCQRSGFGKELYEFMLKNEGVTPNKIAIDKPSVKLLGFMRKYYGMSDYLQQNNNYVVYKQYFGNFGGEEYRRSGKPETSFVEKSSDEGFRRKTGVSQAAVRLGLNEGWKKEVEPCRKIYVAVPPWAVSSNFSGLTTTYSQYGGQLRK